MKTTRRGVALSAIGAGVLGASSVAGAAPTFTLLDQSVSVSHRAEMGVVDKMVVVDEFQAGFAEITAENPGMFKKSIVTQLGQFQTTTTIDQSFVMGATQFSGFASFAVMTNNLNGEVDSGYDIHQDLGISFNLSEAAPISFSTFIENNGLFLNPEIRLIDSNGNIVLEGSGEGQIDLAAGDYTLVALLSGRDKFNFETSQSASFGYSFVVIPSPGTIGLIGMAGVVLVSRRRR